MASTQKSTDCNSATPIYKQSAYTLNFALTRRQFRSTVFVVIESSEQQTIAQLAQRFVGVYPQVDPTHVSRIVQVTASTPH
jgi:hypothetical protein